MSSETAVTKPVLPPLQTPKSASFPSEVMSTPMSAHNLSAHPLSAFIKAEQDLRTPITPPIAYTDFLKALTPVLATPPPSGLSRSMSDESTTSAKESVTSSHSSKTGLSPNSAERVFSLTSAPHSAPLHGHGRTGSSHLKRIRIPYSPLWSPYNGTQTPRTAMSLSGAMYSPFSPADWTGRSNMDYLATPRSASAKPVSVRSVVTRTITYKRSAPSTPIMEPAPKGKRRKMPSVAPSLLSAADSKDLRQKLQSIQESDSETKDVKGIKEEKGVEESKDLVTMLPPPPVINVSRASSGESSDSEGSDISSSSDSEGSSASP